MHTRQQLQIAVVRCRRIRASLAKLKCTGHLTPKQHQVAARQLCQMTQAVLAECEETIDADYRQLVREMADIHDRCQPGKDQAFKKWIDLDNDRADKLLAKNPIHPKTYPEFKQYVLDILLAEPDDVRQQLVGALDSMFAEVETRLTRRAQCKVAQFCKNITRIVPEIGSVIFQLSSTFDDEHPYQFVMGYFMMSALFERGAEQLQRMLFSGIDVTEAMVCNAMMSMDGLVGHFAQNRAIVDSIEVLIVWHRLFWQGKKVPTVDMPLARLSITDSITSTAEVGLFRVLGSQLAAKYGGSTVCKYMLPFLGFPTATSMVMQTVALLAQPIVRGQLREAGAEFVAGFKDGKRSTIHAASPRVGASGAR